jgi:diguanylate cyclase (GGDEF)-like protein
LTFRMEVLDLSRSMQENENHDRPERGLSNFDLSIISIMTHLYRCGGVEDEIMETLRKLNIEYHTLLDKNNILEQKINIDAKTNLLTYRIDYLAMVVRSAWRILDIIPHKEYMVSYIRFDIDDFARLNNRFGHDKGDIVLVDLADILKANSRPTDYLIRFGGEEYDALLPSTDLIGAVVYLNKVFRSIRKMRYYFDNIEVGVSVSAGVALFSTDFRRLKRIDDENMNKEYLMLQKAADNALYDAKLSGKNQYKIHNDAIDYMEVRRKYNEHY